MNEADPSSDPGSGKEANPASEEQQSLARLDVDPEEEQVERVAEILRPALKDSQSAQELTARVLEVTRHYSGPLPPPDYLQGYDAAVAGSASRIVNMAEREQSHRHKIQRLETQYPYVGLITGFVIALACVGGAIFLALRGQTAVALALLSVPAIGVVGWFINSRLTSSSD